MDTVTLRQELHEYINVADNEKLEAMYSIMKDEPYQWWNDEELIKELDRRSDDLKSGKDKGFTLEESRENLMACLNRKNGAI